MGALFSSMIAACSCSLFDLHPITVYSGAGVNFFQGVTLNSRSVVNAEAVRLPEGVSKSKFQIAFVHIDKYICQNKKYICPALQIYLSLLRGAQWLTQ